MTQAGTGTLVLTGNNDYSGTTTISSGTLQIGDGGSTGSLGTVGVSNDGVLAFNRSDTLTVGNAIGGLGSVTQFGSGTTVLTGNNTYLGGTRIAAGELQIGEARALSTGPVTLEGGQLTTTADMTLPNDIQFVAGQAGALAAATGTTLSFSGRMLARDVARFGSSNAAGAIDLEGDLADHSATTGIHVAAGTLRGTQLSSFTSRAASVTVDAGAAIEYQGDGKLNGLFGAGTVWAKGTTLEVGSGDFAGTITGDATLSQSASGSLVLSGDNTYTGATHIDGVLQIGKGGTSGTLGAGEVLDNGSLRFDRSNDYTVGNVISGTGSLTQAGSGRLVLTAANTYSGPTLVNAGTLSVNGSIVGPAIVNNGGTLGGTGTVGSVTVASGGTLAPGNSIGTLTVKGNLSFAPGSIYRVKADATGAADRVNTTGTIAISGGTVDVQASGGSYQRNTRYTILDSGDGITGRFADATTNLAFLTPTLIYEGKAVLLDLQAGDYPSVAHTPNQAAVANHLDGFADAPGNATAGGLIQQIDNSTAEQARQAFESLSGSAHASASQVAAALGRNFSATLSRRTSFSLAGPPSSTALASTQARQSRCQPVRSPDGDERRAGRPGQPGSRRGDAPALLTGARPLAAGAGLGRPCRQRRQQQWLALSQQWLHARLRPAGARGLAGRRSAGLQPQLMERHQRRPDQRRHRFSASRPLCALCQRRLARALRCDLRQPRLQHGPHGHHRRHKVQCQLEPRRPRMGTVRTGRGSDADGRLGAAPADGVAPCPPGRKRLQRDGAGAGDLAVADRTTRNTLFSYGVHFVRLFNQGKGGLELRAVASHLSGDNNSPVTASLAGQPGSFTANGTPLKRNALTLGATLSGQFSKRVSGYLDANYEYRGSGQNAYQATAGVRVSF